MKILKIILNAVCCWPVLAIINSLSSWLNKKPAAISWNIENDRVHADLDQTTSCWNKIYSGNSENVRRPFPIPFSFNFRYAANLVRHCWSSSPCPMVHFWYICFDIPSCFSYYFPHFKLLPKWDWKMSQLQTAHFWDIWDICTEYPSRSPYYFRHSGLGIRGISQKLNAPPLPIVHFWEIWEILAESFAMMERLNMGHMTRT